MPPLFQFREAFQDVAYRSIMPTNLGSAELQQLGRDVINNSFFSARNTLTDLLEVEKAKVLQLTQGEIDIASARLEVKQMAARLGYEPDEDKRGGLQDLSSTPRVNLVLKTNQQIAQGYAYDRQGQTEAILDEWPAQELFRAETRAVPRGEKRTKEGIEPDPENAW
ncbi:MAG: hypothetical protein JWR69_9, partial [Pedosphaera sp.]|nr:hypothetical protein [Pedosphaera sp.]